MLRRDVITLLGGALAGPHIACAEPARRPVIGVLDRGAIDPGSATMAAFRQGLADAGFVVGRNVEIEARPVHFRRLKQSVADLVGRRVAVILAGGGSAVAALEAKAATSTIPIVFATGANPVKSGLVASLNRPGGNVTGVTFLSTELGGKRLDLLHELARKRPRSPICRPDRQRRLRRSRMRTFLPRRGYCKRRSRPSNAQTCATSRQPSRPWRKTASAP
jgi:putative ABC transport system substrate-binding protein